MRDIDDVVSNERLEELRTMFAPSANKDVYLALGELLALRKERGWAEPVAWKLEFQEAVTDDYSRHCVAFMEEEPPAGPYRDCATPLYTAPPAPVAVPDKWPEKLTWSHHDDMTQAEVLAWNNAIDACRAAMLKESD